MTDLGTFSATAMSEVTAVNLGGDTRFTLDYAAAINDNDQIVGSGSNAQGHEHAFLLTPS